MGVQRLPIYAVAVVAVCVSTRQETAAAEAEGPPLVICARLDNQPVTPATARYVSRALREAEQANAECFVLLLDTPGGLVESTRGIVTDILASDVPVVVYVSPAGGRAASAGLFITQAAHVAAMAPGTHIGAAHPVQLGGLPTQPPASPEPDGGNDSDRNGGSALEKKLVNDTSTWARSLAELRGRNAQWAELAVTESRSIVAREALEDNVVDLIATDLDDLLAQLDGRELILARRTVRLNTAGAEVRTVEMWWGESLLGVISNPNVAFLLLIFGFYGILFEIYTPGWGVSGTLGMICLLLGFFALAVLPVNYVGLALIALALGLFVAEAFVASYGTLTLGGCICLVLGALMLVESPGGFMQVSLWVAVPVAVATALITLFLVSRIVRAHRSPVQTGGEALARQEATAKEAFTASGDEYHGTVFLHGEYWRAVSPQPVAAGQSVRVNHLKGLTLIVEPLEQIDESQPASKSPRPEQPIA